MLLGARIVLTLVAAASIQQAALNDGPVSLVGCLQPVEGDTASFVLTDARPAAAGEDLTTSAGAGASVAGESPSGSVSADTPTGSTATETSAPTPSTGAPDATANPASGTFNQGTRDVTTGTTGSVPRADGAAAEAVRRYRVDGAPRVNLEAHSGRLVRIDGSLKAAAAPSAGSDSETGREPVVTATAIRQIAVSCEK